VCARVKAPDHLIAGARGRLEPNEIQDLDPSAVVADQFAPLQFAGGLRNALAPQTEHMRQEVLRQGKVIGCHPLTGHEQPARQACLRVVKAVACGRLRDLRHQGIRVSKERLLQRAIAVEFGPKERRGHAQGLAAALYECTDPRDFHTQDEGHPDHALVANHAHFEGAAPVDGREQGHKRCDRKVDVPDCLAGLVEDLPESEHHRLELRTQLLCFIGRQAGQYAVRGT